MDKLDLGTIITTSVRLLALGAIYHTGQVGALYTLVAIILFEISNSNDQLLQWLESVAIVLCVAITYASYSQPNHFYIGLLSSFAFIRLLLQKDLNDLNLVSALIAFVGVNVVAFGLVSPELSGSVYIAWPFLLCGLVACQTQGRLFIVGSLLAVAWNAGMNVEIIKFVLMLSFIIELFSSNKNKALQVSVLAGVFLAPFHTWSSIAVIMICLSTLQVINRQAMQIFAAVVALFSCLIITDSIYVSCLVVLTLVVFLIKYKKQESLYVRG